MRSPGSSVAHTTPGRLHGWIAAGIASFEVLDQSPSPSSAGWVVGLSNRLSKTPSGTGAQVDALAERSSAAELSSRGTCCSSKASKSFSSFLTWMRYAASLGLLQLQVTSSSSLPGDISDYREEERQPKLSSYLFLVNPILSFTLRIIFLVVQSFLLVFLHPHPHLHPRLPTHAPAL